MGKTHRHGEEDDGGSENSDKAGEQLRCAKFRRSGPHQFNKLRADLWLLKSFAEIA